MVLACEQPSATAGELDWHHSLSSWSSTHMVHMSYTIEINRPNNIILFKRMNQRIVDQHKILVGKSIPDMQHHMMSFEQAYGVRIHAKNWGNWTHIEFPSESAYVAALLKFG